MAQARQAKAAAVPEAHEGFRGAKAHGKIGVALAGGAGPGRSDEGRTFASSAVVRSNRQALHAEAFEGEGIDEPELGAEDAGPVMPRGASLPLHHGLGERAG
jgi:hypothetical protein